MPVCMPRAGVVGQEGAHLSMSRGCHRNVSDMESGFSGTAWAFSVRVPATGVAARCCPGAASLVLIVGADRLSEPAGGETCGKNWMLVPVSDGSRLR